jgi:hypothetical protein
MLADRALAGHTSFLAWMVPLSDITTESDWRHDLRFLFPTIQPPYSHPLTIRHIPPHPRPGQRVMSVTMAERRIIGALVKDVK